MTTQTFLGTLVHVSCCVCGTTFGVEQTLHSERHRTGKNFFCPSGHSLSYTENETERLRKRLDATEKARIKAVDEAAYQRTCREQVERSARAVRGHLTRVKSRVRHGVCPCCNRSFSNLARHMDAKHPDYANEAII